MELTDINFLHEVQLCGSRQMDARSICILHDLSPLQTRIFMQEFDNMDSDIRHHWEKGKLAKQQEIEEKLEAHVVSGEDGAGDAARALGYMQRKRQSDALKKELFNI